MRAGVHTQTQRHRGGRRTRIRKGAAPSLPWRANPKAEALRTVKASKPRRPTPAAFERKPGVECGGNADRLKTSNRRPLDTCRVWARSNMECGGNRLRFPIRTPGARRFRSAASSEAKAYQERSITVPGTRIRQRRRCRRTPKRPETRIASSYGAAQFSSLNPRTRRKCFMLFETSATSSASACAAIMTSICPMGDPRFSRSAAMSP